MRYVEILLDYGLHCVGCFASSFDTLEAGAMIHGILEEELEEMVTRINEVISHGE
jgi:hybrid cluster-associated redox disulfide protein